MTRAKTTGTRANESPNMTPIAARIANIMNRNREKAAILSENSDKNSATFPLFSHVQHLNELRDFSSFKLYKLMYKLSNLLRLTQNGPVIGHQFDLRKIINPFCHLVNQFRTDKLVTFQYDGLYRTNRKTLP